jgi:hypothetical protein
MRTVAQVRKQVKVGTTLGENQKCSVANFVLLLSLLCFHCWWDNQHDCGHDSLPVFYRMQQVPHTKRQNRWNERMVLLHAIRLFQVVLSTLTLVRYVTTQVAIQATATAFGPRPTARPHFFQAAAAPYCCFLALLLLLRGTSSRLLRYWIPSSEST